MDYGRWVKRVRSRVLASATRYTECNRELRKRGWRKIGVEKESLLFEMLARELRDDFQ